MDLDINDPELEKENFICVAGEYSNGFIKCKIPELQDHEDKSLFFNVDVSLNGQ